MRIWSRMRRPIAGQWERDNDDSFFWGTTGRACEKAAYVHALYVGNATAQLQESASLFLDI